MKSILYPFLFFVANTVTAADEPILADFATGYQLITNADAAIYRLLLPENVYKTAVRSDLGDIRVFNQDNQRVPHAIRRTEMKQTGDAIRINLPFFPVHSEDNKINKNENIDFTINEDGTIIQIKTIGNELVAENAEIDSYVIDLSDIRQNVDELEFGLTGKEGGYIERASLQYSNDLNNWSTLVSNITLTELDYGNHVLRNNKIKLPNKKVKYLKFSWRDHNNRIQIRSIHATLNSVRTERERQWSVVTGKPSEEEKQIYDFDTGGLFPVDRVNIVLPEDNTLIEAVLRSRKDKETDWRLRHTGLFYNLNVKGNYLERGPISLSLTTDRFWQLEVKTEDGLGQESPRLKFAWAPDDIYFLARGQGPFKLAFGNSQADVPGRPINVLMNVLGEDQESDFIGEAILGDELMLMGEDALQSKLVIPWQRILLWGVLVTGVLIIGVMAIRLFKQINVTKTDEV
jgi:hypothetical protein